MRIRKRGLQIKRGNFFRRKLVLDSLKSKIAFFVIVFLFGVVIFIGILDVVDYKVNLVNDLEDRVDGESGGVVGMSPSETSKLVP